MASGSFEVEPGVFMSASCHHRQHGACGPCYARVVKALERIEAAGFASDAHAVVAETFAAMTSEARKPQRSARRVLRVTP
jgi:hypothetical protein